MLGRARVDHPQDVRACCIGEPRLRQRPSAWYWPLGKTPADAVDADPATTANMYADVRFDEMQAGVTDLYSTADSNKK